MNVAEAVGQTLARFGAGTVFGVVGSGNFHVTNALAASGARFVAARHEGGAVTMADAYARVSRGLGVVTVHQGPGLTNAVTGMAEAAKSRTPLVVVAGEVAAAAVRSNFRVDQAAIAAAVGAVPERVHSPQTALADVARACRTAVAERRTVLLGLPLDVQAADLPDAPALASARARAGRVPALPVPPPAAVAGLADALQAARRPVFVAGRGARLSGARDALADLAGRCGALPATSAVARGLFAGDPFALDVSGGFATPAAAELIRGADLVVAWGCSLNMWTTRHGALIGRNAALVQVDVDAHALGAHRPVDLALIGDAAETARAASAELEARGHRATGYRTPEVAERLAREGRWQDVPYDEHPGEDGGGPRIDPRTLTIALDGMLPRERTVAVDSGNFMGYPAMFLDVPDDDGLVFTQAFQSVGLGLATAIGAAVARPDRLTVAALGDGGALMSVAELETAVRLGLGLLVLVYDDEAYGAEVHHFGPGGHPLDAVTFPPADLAAIGRGFGCAAATVRTPDDLAAVAGWLAGPRDRPMVVDAKIASRPAWWLEEAFRGH
ncbi:thiamine pyrophosphate-dependent acetolactate synthase large subunit-like protein [Actinomadura luteofluorescens]|uniref:Thiamine pyrophosphate-dependent acetolactate synthase large subunit-like protein n=1 Tax=Actinomadura luteofluorescens TaxID=46163 RepID=A0A7Y9ERT0_9ACTN|nr:thiamine pyrophosphate-binding protein [Actinomadura luteofluorescens]NYD52624.1 thiamine pyrophosphate-dependent acetolactate synthase large subunit-like protein [Actinomadura luteofluorescens]